MPSTYAVTISRPIGEVFQFLSELEHLAIWDDAVRWARRTGAGPLGVGTVFEQAIERHGQAYRAACEVVAYEPPYQLGWVSDLGNARLITRITLQTVGLGTRLTLRRHALGGGGADPDEGAEIVASLRRLRDALEGQRPC